MDATIRKCSKKRYFSRACRSRLLKWKISINQKRIKQNGLKIQAIWTIQQISMENGFYKQTWHWLRKHCFKKDTRSPITKLQYRTKQLIEQQTQPMESEKMNVNKTPIGIVGKIHVKVEKFPTKVENRGFKATEMNPNKKKKLCMDV